MFPPLEVFALQADRASVIGAEGQQRRAYCVGGNLPGGLPEIAEAGREQALREAAVGHIFPFLWNFPAAESCQAILQRGPGKPVPRDR